MLAACWRTLKYLAFAVLTVAAIGICVGLIYVGSILLGAAAAVLLVYLLISEYNRTPDNEKGP